MVGGARAATPEISKTARHYFGVCPLRHERVRVCEVVVLFAGRRLVKGGVMRRSRVINLGVDCGSV